MTFIAIEGIDGSGKSTLSRRLKSYLEDKGYRVFLTSEPYGNPLIREEWIKSGSVESALKLAISFITDRVVHSRKIAERIRKGYIVISDRYFLSTVAYQGLNLKPELATPEKVLSFLLGISEPVEAWPECTIMLDVDPDISVSRISGRKGRSPFEEKGYLEDVRSFYLEIANLIASDRVKWKTLGEIFIIKSNARRSEVMKQATGAVSRFLSGENQSQ